MNEPHTYNLPDENDRASALEQAISEAAVAEIRHKAKRDQEPGPDGYYRILDCVDCGEEIGLGRLHAAIRNTLCIWCATALERRK